LPKLNFLLSYLRFDKDNLELLRRQGRQRFDGFIIDSGAFSAWNSGVKIELDDYCRFLDSIAWLRPFHAVVLDVFGDPEASRRNYDIMKSRGYDVMPVFTRGDTDEALEAYYADTDYVMFGGIVTGSKNANYVKWFLDANRGRKIHLLGFVNMKFIKTYRPTSADSSAWVSGGQYACLDLYRGQGEMLRLDRKAMTKPPSKEVAAMLRGVGLQPGEYIHLGKQTCWETMSWKFEGADWSKPIPGMHVFTTVLGHVKRGIEIEKKLGTKIYHAGGVAMVNNLLFKGYDFLVDRRAI
jgi:hypothetical protein